MDWMTSIQLTIDFIEDNIGDDLDINMLAKESFEFNSILTNLCKIKFIRR
jgi:hypothetical protein